MKYAEPCKEKENHKIGVFVNISRGEIGFSIDGNFSNIAFKSEDLKQGPFYPAVALREGGIASFGKVIKNPEDILNKK